MPTRVSIQAIGFATFSHFILLVVMINKVVFEKDYLGTSANSIIMSRASIMVSRASIMA